MTQMEASCRTQPIGRDAHNVCKMRARAEDNEVINAVDMYASTEHKLHGKVGYVAAILNPGMGYKLLHNKVRTVL